MISLQSWLSNALQVKNMTIFQNRFLPCRSGLHTFWDAFFFFFRSIDQVNFLSSLFARTIFTNFDIICKYLSAIAFTSGHQQQYQVVIEYFFMISAKLHIMLTSLCVPKILLLKMQIFFSVWGCSYMKCFIVISTPGDTQNSNGQGTQQPNLMLKSFLLSARVWLEVPSIILNVKP